MVASNSRKCYGVISMDHQVETVLGPKPRRGPPPATGTSDPKHLAGKGQSKANNAVGRKKMFLGFLTMHSTHFIYCYTELEIYVRNPADATAWATLSN